MTEKSLTKEQAIALHDSKFWESLSLRERAEFQAHQPLVCMPFGVFHEAMEKTLGRSVWTHEFADMDALRKELRGEKPAPSFEDIIALIPEDKRVLVVGP